MTPEEALRQAEAEGLTLVRSATNLKTGYTNVYFLSGRYQAKLRRDGRYVSLGLFATAEEAALAYARSPEGRAAVAAALAPPAPPPMTAEAVLRLAEAEGLTLVRVETSKTGYKGVTFCSGKSKPYHAHVWRSGKTMNLGYFATAEEAALCYARSPEGRAAVAAAAAPPAPAPPPMTAEEALRQAEVEGLTLLKSEGSSTGYKNVSFLSGKTKAYKAQVRRSGKLLNLGQFTTPEEAALVVARTPEGRAAAAAAAAPPAPPPMTAEEALRQVEAEGLTLLRSESNGTGYKGVYFDFKAKTKPYMTMLWRGGKSVTIGYFATAEEAALFYARTPEGRAAVAAAAAPPAAPPMTAGEALRQALRQAEAEGLTLLRSESSKTGYKGVGFNNWIKTKPYQAQVTRGGKRVSLGSFATAEEAALCYARTPEGRAAAAAAAAAAAPPEPPPLTAEEALASPRKRKLTPEEQPCEADMSDSEEDPPAVVILDGQLVDE